MNARTHTRTKTKLPKGFTLEVTGVAETMAAMKVFDETLRLRVMKTAGRRAAAPMVQSYRDEITNFAGDKFTVYRNGSIYAEVRPGQLRDSIAPMFFRSKKRDMIITVIGPRVKGAFRDPNKGGWFAHFINYGYLSDGKYIGKNLGFAERAQQKAASSVNAEFKLVFFQEAQKYINRLVKRQAKGK